MSGIDRPAIVAFFENLYGDAVDDHSRLVLWSTRNKRTTWAKSIPEAAAAVEQIAAVSDAYFGVCLQGRDLAIEERRKRKGDEAVTDAGMVYARGYASTVAVIPGLWLDLDVAGSGHEKQGLPSSAAEAWKIIEALPFAPTLSLRTGGGFHSYWLFREPWIIESQEERDRAAGCIRGWQNLAIDAGASFGYAVDSTHDLVRVLRPAGTVNYKYGVPVRPVEDPNSPRYNPSDFEDWASEVKPPPSESKIGQLTGELADSLRPDAQPPTEKLLAMLNLQPSFAATWNGERSSTWSQSEYDLSLATMAANAGWKPSEITALVIAHRRQNGKDLKIDRPRYYPTLLTKATARAEVAEAQERIEDRVDSIQQGDSTPTEERDGIITDLSALLGFPIRRIIKYLSDPPQYRLVLEQGTIHLGDVNTILNPARFRAAIAAVSGTLIQRFAGSAWDPVATAILQAVEELDLGADSSAEALVTEWLTEYLSQHAPSLERADAIAVRTPFVLEIPGDPSRVAFFLSEFRSWLSFHRDERLGRRQLATLLRAASAEPRVVRYTRESDGHGSSVHVWLVSLAVSSTLPIIGEKIQSNREASTNHNG